MIQTKVFRVYDDGERIVEEWDDFLFDPKQYVAHTRDGEFSILYLKGILPLKIQLNFDDLTNELKIFNTFETINLN